MSCLVQRAIRPSPNQAREPNPFASAIWIEGYRENLPLHHTYSNLMGSSRSACNVCEHLFSFSPLVSPSLLVLARVGSKAWFLHSLAIESLPLAMKPAIFQQAYIAFPTKAKKSKRGHGYPSLGLKAALFLSLSLFLFENKK